MNEIIDLTLSSVDKKTKPNEHAVKLCNYMDVYSNSFIHDGLHFMEATATEREISRCALRKGDVVITKDSEKYDDIGIPAVVSEDIPNLVCGYHLAILRPILNTIDGKYLFYALNAKEVQHQFHAYANGITRFGLRKADIGRVEIPLPSFPEQRRIAHILGTLDDKIEMNRRMNATLEEMAQGLFKSWFVDFKPVRAKMEGRWRRGESLPGMPAELYDLFPDRLVPSEPGEMPEGWEVKAIEEIVNINPESWSRSNSPFEVKYVDLANTKWGTIQTIQHHLWADAPSRARRILRPGDTIMSTVRPGNGSYALIGEERLTGSTGFAVLRPSEERFREITYLACTSKENVEWLAHLADGGAYPAIRPEVVGQTRIVIPVCDGALVNCFSSFIAPLFAKATSNNIESSTTSALRDSLLPKLMSGKANFGDG